MTSRTFPLTAPIRLVGRIAHGSFTVHAVADTTQARVEITARGDQRVLEHAAVELHGCTLEVTLPRQGGIFDLPLLSRGLARDEVDVVVTVPTGTATRISTYTAPVRIEGTIGDSDVATGAADVEIGAVEGDLRLRYGSGTAEVGSVTGSVQARSGSGSARFGEIGGSLTSACGSGELVVSTAHGSVRSRAGSGGASLGAVFGDVDLVSASGAVSIGLPGGRSAKLELLTGSGRVDSDLPVEPTATNAGRPITVRVRTGSGDIRLVRAVHAA
ncbi:MAG: hypothetical protein QOE97_147 [Pseudonocardiales bacterium]|jgi:hypothetical protein|nr:hypothetical protein [Pseudonocardiales bacterium]